MSSDIIKDFTDAIISANAKKTSGYDTQATVKRVEDDTIWVHIPGGVDETPVKRTVSAKVGDVVQVRVANGTAWITGNLSNPPTDDTKAEEANTMAKTANTKANKASDDVAELAKKIGGNDNQYFWHVESGTDTGSHITEIPKDSFISNPQGNNILIRSNGIAIRDAMDEVAIFGNDGVRIGKTNETHAEISSNSMKLIDYQGNPYMYISDLRIKVPGEDLPVATLTEILTGDGTSAEFLLGTPEIYTINSVYMDGVEITNEVTQKGKNIIEITPPPDNGAVIEVKYTTRDVTAKAYTLGVRQPDANVGSMSIAEGYLTIASKLAAHAEGNYTQANGISSHAEGQYAEANGISSHAEGFGVKANGISSHAEGNYTQANGISSHAEGSNTNTSGTSSHAEGYYTKALGNYSHAQNQYTTAGYANQTTIGKYNKNQSDTAFEIGNGTYTLRSNAFSVDWGGNIRMALDTTASTGTVDGGLYRAITALGWEGDVIDA